MNNNDARFSALRQRVGGEREVMGYEMSFGMPKETMWHITPPNGTIRRVMSELEFALKLDDANDGKFADDISAALDTAEKAIESDGTLTFSACGETEKKLLPLEKAAKEYSLILCGHAHIDMNWMWGWNETVSATLATFRTMLDLMDEYPDFTFSQSQTSVYRLVEEYDPDMMKRIKARIDEGRWEITSTAWVETDKNMPSGESLLNTVRYTRDYLEKTWGVDPESLKIDFSPDTFGHSAHIPEIDSFAGIKYYYHCRGLDGDHILYRYKSPSGAEILMYREPYWYNSAITPHVGPGLIDLSRRMGGLKTGLIVYGVGNHGGGVTRRDIERAIEMKSWRIWPEMRFGTFREFFSIADKPEIREKLPVVDRELNFLFDGCYTTQSRIKRANRMTEAKLIEASSLSALGHDIFGARYNSGAYETAWRNVLFTHFHDILTGSCVQDSREYAMGLYQTAAAHAETEENLALRALSDAVDSSMVELSDEEIKRGSQSEGAGVGFGVTNFSGVPNPERGVGLTRVFTLYNPAGTEREDVTELRIWDWTGDIRRLRVTDAEGKPLEFAVIDGSFQRYWDHQFNRLLVRVKIPAYGYTTVVVRQAEVEKYPFYYKDTHNVLSYENSYVLENEHIRAEFDQQTMSLISLIDKKDGSEKINRDEFAGIVGIDAQLEGSSAWVIGKYHAVKPLTDIRRVDRFGFGGLRQGYRFDAGIYNSTVNCEITLDAGAKALSYHINVDWNETAGRFAPMLALRMPVGYAVSGYMRDVPMGVATTEDRNHDIPAQSYILAAPALSAEILETAPLYVMTDSKYGYRAYEGVLTSTLINTAHNPDFDPERGRHEITVAVGVGASCPRGMADISESFRFPVRYASTNPHKGTLAPAGKLFTAETGSAKITSITLTDDGKLLVRLNELAGRNAEITLGLTKNVKSAALVDLSGHKTGAAEVSGNRVTFAVGPYRISSVEITLA